HLSYLLTDEVRAAETLGQEGIEALVAEKLDGAGSTCEVAAVLARLLSREADPFDADRVRELMRRRSSDGFDIWFGGMADLSLRTFAIALAVLNGLPYEDVADAARRLRGRLARTPALRLTAGAEVQPI